MERTISQEERIRRAEEIYNRRKEAARSGIRVSGDSVNSNKSKISLFKKMGLQLAICSVIYIIFYLIKNTNYIFSEDVITKTKEMLSYDINFGNVYSQVNSFIENNKNNIPFLQSNEDNNSIINEQANENVQNTDANNNMGQNAVGTDTNKEENKNVTTNTQGNTTNNNQTNIQSNTTTNSESKNNNQGIGGAEPNDTKQTSADEEKTQMEIDAEYVKKKYSLKIPLKGTVTSRYGAREATEIVSANHQGIDIGANKGTAIYAAMAGTVSLVSSKGDYRKTCRNKKWRNTYKICTL